MKKTMVIGASENPVRYSNLAIKNLRSKNVETVAVGLKAGTVADVSILTGFPEVSGIDTVTLYVGPKHQAHWQSYILGLHPNRVIFNPGTENPDFENTLKENGIEAERACTLVLLNTGTY